MSIVARIDVFDDETGNEYVQNQIIKPDISDFDNFDFTTTYAFCFKVCIEKGKNNEDQNNSKRD